MTKRHLLYILLCGLSLVGYVLVGYAIPREQAGQVVLAYLLLGGAAYALYSLSRSAEVEWLVVLGLLSRLVFLFAIPELSDDFFRYLWDGHLVARGVDPFALHPSQVPESLRPSLGPEAEAMLAFKDYYSVYPPVAQGLFGLTRLLSGDSVIGGVVALRSMVLLMELGSVILIARLLTSWQLDRRLVLLYALNPLVIIELSGNLHLEVVMIFFMLLSAWLLGRSRLLLAAGAFGLAIGAKLIPVLFLPLLLKRMGWRKTIAFSAVAMLVFAAGFIPVGFQHLDHLLETVRYYYNLFEFNGSLFAWAKGLGGSAWATDLGPAFAVLTLAVLLVIVIIDRGRALSTLLPTVVIFLTLYHLLATTVNPWYLTPLVAFSVFSNYRFALVWGFLVPVSYAAFAHADYHIPTPLLLVEYIPVFTLLLFELLRRSYLGKRFQTWHVLLRARIKVRRIASFVPSPSAVLDIGTGNGGVAHLMRSGGTAVTTVDVKDKCLFLDVAPGVFDGHTLPFPANSFPTVTLLTVLHHTRDPEGLLREAARVSEARVIVMEDVYLNALQRILTKLADSLVNWEFSGHPHTNRTEAAWETCFEAMSLKIESKRVHRFLLVFRQVTYVLHK